MKDYYKILGVSPSASLSELKNAYRKLAHLYHPDKNQENLYAATHFNLIKEAYTTLTSPELKEKHLKERWLFKSTGNPFEDTSYTPPEILVKIIAAYHHFIQLDEYRIDKNGLFNTVKKLTDDDTITVLNQFNKVDINYQVVKTLINTINILYPKDQLAILERLKKINNPSDTHGIIQNKIREVKNSVRWNRFKPVLIILIIIILCIIIASSL